MMQGKYGHRPRDLALLLIDLQKDFVDPRSPVGSVGKSLCIPGVATLLWHCRRIEIPIIHIITLHDTSGSTLLPKHRSSRLLYCVEGTEGAQIVPQVAPLPKEYIVVKRKISAFFHTNLEPILKEFHVKTLILTGLALDCCVKATALDAAQRGLQVIVPYQAVSSSSVRKYSAGLNFIAETAGQIVDLHDLINFLQNPNLELPEMDINKAVMWFKEQLNKLTKGAV